MLSAIRSLFGGGKESDVRNDSGTVVDPVHLAACALLLDVAYADGEFSAPERAHLEEILTRHFGLSPEVGAKLIEVADEERRNAIDHFRFTSVLREQYDLGQKMVLAEVMWGLVLSDGAVAEHEHYLARKRSAEQRRRDYQG
jgi:uncharacterized tellurite resistance protein B-like protein